MANVQVPDLTVAQMGHVSPGEVYVVDYDLPADNRRKRFYRRVTAYLRDHHLEETEWSTWSTAFTSDEDFAWFLYNTARAVGGTAHVWAARRLDDEPEGGE